MHRHANICICNFLLMKIHTNIYPDSLNLLHYKNPLPNIVRNSDFMSLYGNFNLKNCSIRHKKGNKTNNDKRKLDILKLKRGLYTVLIPTI